MSLLHEMQDRIKDEYYTQYRKIPYPEEKERYNKEMKKSMEIFKQDLRVVANDELGIELTDEEFKALFERAWEEGHSCGFMEVFGDAWELIDMLRPFMKRVKE